jgi:hypothetical protein
MIADGIIVSNCRCSTITLTEAQARQRGWIGTPKALPGDVQPDDGWDYNPATGQDAMIDKIAAQKIAKANPVVAKKVNGVLVSGPPAAGIFEAQKTAEQAAEWAVKNNLADFADYTGVDVRVANAFNRSSYEHMQEFPALRDAQRFIGCHKPQFALELKIRKEKYIQQLIDTKKFDKELAEKYANEVLKAERAPPRAMAISVPWGSVRGVSVIEKWGKDYDALASRIAELESKQWLANGTVKSIVDHEFGHQIDDLLNVRMDESVKSVYKESVAKGIKSEVSEYAGKDISEFVAECWAEFRNSQQPRGAARIVGMAVKERYRSKYGS